MSKRVRKFLSIPLILLIIIFWSWGAMVVYETFLTAAPMGWVLFFYGVAGMGWFFPAAAVISWAEHSRKKQNQEQS